MFWLAKGARRLRSLDDRVAALQAGLDEATARYDLLLAKAEDAKQRSKSERERYDEQSSLLVRFGEALADLRGMVDEQAAAGERLKEADERQERALDQLRADVIRTQRQAELDLAEMRQTNTAVVASVLLQRNDQRNNV